MFFFFVLAATLGIYGLDLATPQRDYFLERHGELLHQDVIETARDGRVLETVSLESSTGLAVDLRVRRPAVTANERLPVFIIVSGHKTGKDAVDLVGDSHHIAFVAIDYPYEGSHSMRGFWAYASAVPSFQRTLLDTPPSLSLLVDWLVAQDWVDPGRIELLGISLGVPFAAVAGALDERFSRVWLVHGGADNVSWVMHVGRKAVKNQALRRFLTESLLLLVYGNSFDTAQWIQEIAPRPLVIIAAQDDDRVPAAARGPFIEAAKSETVDLIWTNGLHIHPDRPEVVRQLLDIVATRAANDPDQLAHY